MKIYTSLDTYIYIHLQKSISALELEILTGVFFGGFSHDEGTEWWKTFNQSESNDIPIA